MFTTTVKSSLQEMLEGKTPHVQPGKTLNFIENLYVDGETFSGDFQDEPDVEVQYTVPKDALKPVMGSTIYTIKSTLPVNEITRCTVYFGQDKLNHQYTHIHVPVIAPGVIDYTNAMLSAAKRKHSLYVLDCVLKNTAPAEREAAEAELKQTMEAKRNGEYNKGVEVLQDILSTNDFGVAALTYRPDNLLLNKCVYADYTAMDLVMRTIQGVMQEAVPKLDVKSLESIDEFLAVLTQSKDIIGEDQKPEDVISVMKNALAQWSQHLEPNFAEKLHQVAQNVPDIVNFHSRDMLYAIPSMLREAAQCTEGLFPTINYANGIHAESAIMSSFHLEVESMRQSDPTTSLYDAQCEAAANILKQAKESKEARECGTAQTEDEIDIFEDLDEFEPE